jgi:hypothetical protein
MQDNSAASIGIDKTISKAKSAEQKQKAQNYFCLLLRIGPRSEIRSRLDRSAEARWPFEEGLEGFAETVSAALTRKSLGFEAHDPVLP